MIYPYVGIIQIRFWVQTIQPVLSLLTASSPLPDIIAHMEEKCNDMLKSKYLLTPISFIMKEKMRSEINVQ